MKTMLLAAAAALSLGFGTAYAGDADPGVTQFTTIEAQQGHEPAPGPVVAANAPYGAAYHAFVTTSHSAGTWLFPPAQDRGN